MPGAGLGNDQLDSHCRSRLASYKCPKSYELVEQLPRNDAGKIRRSQLAADREAVTART
jgi:acyl-CoA synthetase (AMP-forming)/AMP-acid ligase II